MKTIFHWRQNQSAVVQRSNRRMRRGLTLLEILLATVILATALAVIGQQNAIGVQAAIRTQLETEAAVHCQNLLNQLIATNNSTGNTPEQSIAATDGWLWSSTITSSSFEHLQWLTVTVRKPGRYEAMSRSSLTRLVPAKEQGDVR